MPTTNRQPLKALLLIAAVALLLAGLAAVSRAQSYTVQGILWVDANGNGIREAGEGTLPGTRITLMYVGPDSVAYTQDDQQIEQSTASSGTPTIAAGSFRFTLGGANERYYLAILGNNKPSGYVPTLYRQGSATADSDLLARTDLPAFITDTFLIDYGANITGIDLGLVPLLLDKQLFLPLLDT